MSKFKNKALIVPQIKQTPKKLPKIIAFEGVDCSGKSTHANLLLKKLSEKYCVALFKFPMLKNNVTGMMLEKIFKGEYGSIADIDPGFVAALFTANRFDFLSGHGSHGVGKDVVFSSYDYVIFDRYTYSNIAYQCARRKSGSRLLQKLIINMEKDLPQPDIVVYTVSPMNMVLDRLKKKHKNTGGDIFELDDEFLYSVEYKYYELFEGPNSMVRRDRVIRLETYNTTEHCHDTLMVYLEEMEEYMEEERKKACK